MGEATGEWIGTAEIADLLRCSVSTVQRTMADPARADRFYGSGNWKDRPSPIYLKRVYFARRSRVEEIAAEEPR